MLIPLGYHPPRAGAHAVAFRKSARIQMNVHDSPKVLKFFRRVFQMRGWIVGVFIVLTAAGIYGTTRIPNDPAIDRLVVAGDPTARATIEFDRLFPEGEQALIMLEGPDPLSPAALRTADQLEQQLEKIPGVKHTACSTSSAAQIPKRKSATAKPNACAHSATGTPLFRRAGLLGDHYLGIGLELRVSSPEERDTRIGGHRFAGSSAGESPTVPFTAVRRVGSPWLNAWLERQTGSGHQEVHALVRHLSGRIGTSSSIGRFAPWAQSSSHWAPS